MSGLGCFIGFGSTVGFGAYKAMAEYVVLYQVSGKIVRRCWRNRQKCIPTPAF